MQRSLRQEDSALVTNIFINLFQTHEEAVCDLLRDYPWSYRNLPLRLYQITNKFRDEMKPRFGLLRTKEFLMKDLYTFDVDEKAALDTYNAINEAYAKLLDRLGVNYIKGESENKLTWRSKSRFGRLCTLGFVQLKVSPA